MQIPMPRNECFCRGLNTKLKERLNLVKTNTFNELVNMAITQEDCISAHRAEKKRKIPTGLWQNRLNYSGSSALVIAIQPIITQHTSNGTTHWSVGSPLDTTMVQ
jgi:hypothetical protein